MILDPAGLEAAAKARYVAEGLPLWPSWEESSQEVRDHWLARAEIVVRAYLAAVLPPDEENRPDVAGIEAAKQAVYESMPVVLKDLVSRSEAEAAIGVPHGAGVPDHWIADVAVRAYLAAITPDEENPIPDWQFAAREEDRIRGAQEEAHARGFAAGRAAATPDPPDDLTRTWTGTQLTPGHETRTLTGNTPAAASPDERLREADGYEQRIAALDDLVQRAWSLIAAAMSGSPRQFSDEWKDSAERWEVDYCMGQGASGLRSRSSVGGGGVVSAVDADAPHQREPGEAPDTPGTCRAPHCWIEYGTPCANCPEEKR